MPGHARGRGMAFDAPLPSDSRSRSPRLPSQAGDESGRRRLERGPIGGGRIGCLNYHKGSGGTPSPPHVGVPPYIENVPPRIDKAIYS